ncbi:MAG TPA: hypothetical protein VFN22_02490 [Gemmatimonadales bacterium]|nr:hypothetical protein [Gemmatimonadales bacterium]
MIHRACRVALGVVLLAGPRVSAQSPSERRALDRFRDSLALESDTSRLAALEQMLMARAKADRDAPMLHLHLGVLALRLGELLPEGSHLEDALGEFEWASDLRPDWPWPWFGLGLAESRGADRAAGTAGGLYVMLGLDRDQRAGAAFRRALEADPHFVHGILEFARVALTQRIAPPIDAALRTLRVATASPVGWDPDLLLARGRLERLAGHPDSALLAFRRAERLGARNGLAWLEIARTLPLDTTVSEPQRRAATTRIYLAGAREGSAEVMAGYRRDLEPIAAPGFLDRLARQDVVHRVATLDAFWRDRDAVDLREPGARLAEHYRRWNVAMQEFRLPPFRRRYLYGIELYRSGDTDFDDRGIVYIRQGEPTVRVRWPLNRQAVHPSALDRTYGSESWRYDRPDGMLTLHFVAREDPQDFRLVDGPTELDVSVDELAAHAHELPGVARMLRAGEATAGWVTEEERSRGRISTAIATQTDAWERGYEEILSGKVQWLAAGIRDGQPLVHLVYAIDADAVRRVARISGGGNVAARVRVAVLDRRGRAVARLDTVQVLAVPSDRARFVAARAEVAVRPGPLRVRVGVELGPRVGVIFPVDSLVAPTPDAPSLELSAVLLGVASRSLPWPITQADTAWLDAGGVYAPGDTLAMYLEGYGLPADAPATLTVAISRPRTGLARLLGGHKTELTLAEVIGPRDAPVLGIHRGIALGTLDPGTYALEVTVSSHGQTVVRRRGFVVRP